MTAPLSQQTVSVKDAAAVRKRRRRAPAGGAADDCFTCSKRNVKCDRRRPYCSQCLEIGNECSGYKTQLTWGVGVASRGKLRGLSLPIAKAPPVFREPKKSPAARGRANSTAAVMPAHWVEQDEVRRHRGPIDIPSLTHSGPSPENSYHGPGYDYLPMSQPDNSAANISQHGWGGLHYSSSGLARSPDATPKYSKFPLPLITDSLSSSVDSVSDVDYLSPLSQTYSRDEMPFGSGSSVMYDGYGGHQQSSASQSPSSGLVLDHTSVPTSCPGLIYTVSEHSSSINLHLDPFDTHLSHKLMRECDSLSVPQNDVYNPSCSPAASSWTSSSYPREDEIQSPQSEHTPIRWPCMFRESEVLRVSPELVSRMPFFTDYYKNTISPSMVYIDGPHNPFRDHVLRLATHSQSLQHAICALSACNLRMKRMLSLGQDTQELLEKLTSEKSVVDGQPDDPLLAEEFQHRNLAVNLLNDQLNDPLKSTNDSVLATILLLCHYRMVESGVARFHTQFAGVKKILSMRTEQFGPSRSSAWMEALFTYFDAISASINDREAQLAPAVDDGLPLLPNGVENLVGCDRELFKTISKLGRLNLLSQNRPVINMAALSSRAGADAPPPHQIIGSPIGHSNNASIGSAGAVQMQRNQHSQHQHQHQHQPQQQIGDMFQTRAHRFDGNGFGTTLNDDEILASAMCASAAFGDRRSLFWREWKDARLALQNWQFDAVAVAAALPESPSPSQVRDLGSLSEAFRYAALLYTERLAGPSTPSSATNFQNLVSQVVYYATSLDAGSTAEKFLLWPLFVAGSECVNELQQNIVRTKCRDIMSRSGYMNNLSALDILEKLWAGEFNAVTPDLRGYRSGPAKMAGCRGPFNWAKCFGGPGAEAEWIMF
ncbi:Zn(2)-C6 fungal-type DNA-binding domain protein [Metarhizium rileyi]|uniref:Zn(2)-C6 fungal-type DNA-binding domain protein n=1 Tax=Metarhizium rileyi (strain RCEF 4871) TaxID=1649241 RepID=A0A166XWK2_METRR|nr:Zn(2)-C6 fungal-type DNA-binding domain protein [Metarhizium rileyi RCEF 4871]